MDVGTAINPKNIKAQIEGSALYGVSQVLYENITMKNGSIEQFLMSLVKLKKATKAK